MSEPHAANSPILSIVGEKVALGPFSRDLIPLLTRWSNDLAARRNIGTPLPQTIEQRTARYERDAMGEEGVDFAVYERATERPIGTVSLFDIDYRNGRADFGILIGEADARQGVRDGSDAPRAGLRLHRVGVADCRPDGGRVERRGAARLCAGRLQGVRTAALLPLDGRPVVGRRAYGRHRRGVR